MKKLFLSIGILSLSSAYAGGAYFTEWREVGEAKTKVYSSLLRGGWVGNSAEQAAELAAQNCPRSKEYKNIELRGEEIIAYRGNAVATGSPYIFSGNCDVKVISRSLIK